MMIDLTGRPPDDGRFSDPPPPSKGDRGELEGRPNPVEGNEPDVLPRGSRAPTAGKYPVLSPQSIAAF